MAETAAPERRRYRKVYARLWTNPDFQKLNDGHKLMTLYLLTGPQTNRIGLFRLSLGAAGEDLGIPVPAVIKRIEHVCKAFAWSFDHGAKVLWIPSWWSFNPPTENANNFKGCLTDLNEVPRSPLISQFCKHLVGIPAGLHALLAPWTPIEHCSNTVRTLEQELELEQKQETALPRVDVVRARFERFWQSYPKKAGKDAAWREWLKRSPSDDLTERMITAVGEQRASAQWLKDGGQFIPHPRTWLHQGRWEDSVDVPIGIGPSPGPSPEQRRYQDAAREAGLAMQRAK